MPVDGRRSDVPRLVPVAFGTHYYGLDGGENRKDTISARASAEIKQTAEARSDNCAKQDCEKCRKQGLTTPRRAPKFPVQWGLTMEEASALHPALRKQVKENQPEIEQDGHEEFLRGAVKKMICVRVAKWNRRQADSRDENYLGRRHEFERGENDSGAPELRAKMGRRRQGRRLAAVSGRARVCAWGPSRPDSGVAGD